MASPFGELFRHNLWANLRLLDYCAGLSDEQLALTAPGTYGKVRETLAHLVGAESRYVAALNGTEGARLEANSFPGFDAVREIASASGAALVSFAEGGLPTDLVERDRDGKHWRIDSAHFLIQAINHATEHRSHVVSILTQNGLTPPDLDGWAYSESVGLIRME